MSKPYLEESKADPGPSRSQRKREMLAVQELCDELARLNAEARNQLNLPPSLHESLEIAARIKSSGARNRQLRHAAKILAADESLQESVKDYFEARNNRARHEQQKHKLVEQWRDRLLDPNEDALSELFKLYPSTDRQEVSTLVRNARKEQLISKPPAQQRKLFKYLRDFVIC